MQMAKVPNLATRHADRTSTSLVTGEFEKPIASSKSDDDVAGNFSTREVVEPNTVEVLPPNYNRGEIVPFEMQLERNRLVRQERLASVSDVLNLVGLKFIGGISLTASLYEAFYLGASQGLLPPAQLFGIAAGCLAGPQAADMILRVLAAVGSAAQGVQRQKQTRRSE
jgi:hypothetical protein